MKQIDSNNSFQKLHQRQEFRKKFPMAIIVYALTVIQCLANLIFPKSPNFNIVVGIFFFIQILLYVFVGHRTEQNRTATIITNRKRRSFLDLNISINILQLLHLILERFGKIPELISSVRPKKIFAIETAKKTKILSHKLKSIEPHDEQN